MDGSFIAREKIARAWKEESKKPFPFTPNMFSFEQEQNYHCFPSKFSSIVILPIFVPFPSAFAMKKKLILTMLRLLS